MLLRLLFTVMILALPSYAAAQGDDFSERLELAKEMVEIQPVEKQMENAVELYIRNYLFTQPEDYQRKFKSAIMGAMKPKAIEKKSVEAYAEIFTKAELQAMVDYYGSDEAKSAAEKRSELDARITPDIVKQLDNALMMMKTGQGTP